MTYSATHFGKEALDWKVIGEPLDRALKALENKIDREWPKELSSYGGAQEVVLFTLKTAINTYETVCWICADKPHYEDRKLEYCVTVPVLARTIVDQIFTIVFISEDVPNKSRLYYRAGWRELREHFNRCQSKYATDLKWAHWLKTRQENLDKSQSSLGITQDEVKDLGRIERWPSPSEMIGRKPNRRRDKDFRIKNTNTKIYLEFLYEWFYRELSQASHQTLPGLMDAGIALNKGKSSANEREKLKDYKSDCFTTTVCLLLALISEIESVARFGLNEKMSYLWGLLIQYWNDAKELYDIRYSELLMVKNGHHLSDRGTSP